MRLEMPTKSSRPGSRKKQGSRPLGRMMFNARRLIRPLFSAEAMAKALHVSKDTVERWEGGHVMPELEQLEEYCRVLLRRGLDQTLVTNIFSRAYPYRPLDPRPRSQLQTDRADSGDADQQVMIVPPDAEGIAEQYWSD